MIEVDTVLIKVASRCNINCGYCYVYNLGDRSWVDMPTHISYETITATAKALGELSLVQQRPFAVVLHGGEPLLLGPTKLSWLISALRGALPSECSFSLQTNGILITEDILKVCLENRTTISVSIDGPRHIHDRNRVGHNGQGTYDKVLEGMKRLQDHPNADFLFSGLLAVIDPKSEPRPRFTAPSKEAPMRRRERGRLKPEHRIVLNALEAANVTHQRVAVVGDVVAALSLYRKDVRRLRKAYVSDLSTSVSKILAQLNDRGVIFSPGVNGGNRYYGSVNALPAEARSLPSMTARRRRVLQMVQDAATELGRPVRTCDVLDYAARHPMEDDINPELITRDIMNLKNTGDLQLVGTALRGDSGGRNYYGNEPLRLAELLTN